MVLSVVACFAFIPGSEVPFRMGDNAIIVDAKVNGHELSFMFDTGFGGSVLVDDKIDLGQSDGTVTMRDFVGPFSAKTVRIKSFLLGGAPVQFSNPEVVQLPTGHISEAYNTHTDGILGFQAIQNRISEINFEHRKFIFHPQSYDISKLVPDNKRTFLVKMLPLGANAVELPVETAHGKKMVLALDTGNAFFATTHRDVLERIGAWEPNRQPKFVHKSYIASGPVDTWEKKLDNLTIFGVPVPESYWDVIDRDAAMAEADGTVGIQFLRNFNITIDYTKRRVWLENFSGKVAEPPVGDVGIFAKGSRRFGTVLVERVVPDTPAFISGIQPGDHILSIEGRETSDTNTVRQVMGALKGPVGSRVHLAVSHNGTVKNYEMTRAALFNP